MNYAACLDQVSLKEDILADQVPSRSRIKVTLLEGSLYYNCEVLRWQLRKTFSSKSYRASTRQMSSEEIQNELSALKINANRLRTVLSSMEALRKFYDSVLIAASRRALSRVGTILDEKIDDLEISLSKNISEALEQLVKVAKSAEFDIERVEKVEARVLPT